MIIRQDGDLAATSLETHSDSQPTLAFRVCRGWALVWRDVVTGIPLWAADMAMLTACWWVVAVVMAWWSLSTPQVMTGPYWTFVISTCFAYWLLGQYPAVCVNPIVETRRCMQGIGMSVVTLAMASLLMVETSSAAVASQLIFVSVLACLA